MLCRIVFVLLLFNYSFWYGLIKQRPAPFLWKKLGWLLVLGNYLRMTGAGPILGSQWVPTYKKFLEPPLKEWNKTSSFQFSQRFSGSFILKQSTRVTICSMSLNAYFLYKYQKNDNYLFFCRKSRLHAIKYINYTFPDEK